jgi:galactokinase
VDRAFAARFGGRHQGVARAPGRVNLIGEHIDYHELPVLPMALTRSVRLAFRARDDDRVVVVNEATPLGERSFVLSDEPLPGPQGDWGNYLLAAAGVARAFGVRRGLDAVLSSDLPAAAGLSSSSALVVGTAMALLSASEIEVPRLELAAALARGERFVGTEGGGMDQAVSVGARSGHALRIDFAPLRWRAVPWPADWRVVVAHSGVTAEKSAGAQQAYNRRRSESEEARLAVVRGLGPGGPEADDAGYRTLLATYAPAELLDAGGRVLDEVHLRRFRHVVTEAARVEQAEVALRAGDIARLGALLVASHASLRDDYEVSHPRLDALVEAALAAGAKGARLTGAGFGGCVVALTDATAAAAVRTAVGRALEGLGVPPASALVFVADPSSGAEVRLARGTLS